MTDFNRITRLNQAVDFLMKSKIVGTQKDIAEMMGMQRSTVNAAINGQGNGPSDKFLRNFARTFSFDADYLITGKGELVPEKPTNAVTMGDNSGIVNNGGTNVTNTVHHGKVSSSEHDELIKLRAERDSIKHIIETLGNSEMTVSVIASILGVKIEK